MMTLTEIFSIILIHWIADFIFQTDKMAKGKSKNWSDLLSHTLTYSVIPWTLFGMLFFSSTIPFYTPDWIIPTFIFVIITFITHTVTDYFTSRLNSKLWSEGKVHYFFVSVGFDQVLHYIQLFTTYYFLTKTLA